MVLIVVNNNQDTWQKSKENDDNGGNDVNNLGQEPCELILFPSISKSKVRNNLFKNIYLRPFKQQLFSAATGALYA